MALLSMVLAKAVERADGMAALLGGADAALLANPFSANISPSGACGVANAPPQTVVCAIILRFRYDPGQIMPPADLDAIDRRILRVLQENARIPNVDLAQAVGLSPSPCLRLRTRVVQGTLGSVR